MSDRTEVEVAELTKFGFKTPEGEYVNFSKLFKEQEIVQPGVTISADIYTAPSGKRYLNKVFTAVKGEVSSPVTVKTSQEAKKAMGIGDVPTKTYTPRDYDKEARGKTFSQMLAAALQAQAVNSLSNTLEELIDNANVVAQKAFSLVFKDEEYKG